MRTSLHTLLITGLIWLGLGAPLNAAPASPPASSAVAFPFEKTPGKAEFPSASAIILSDDIQATVQADGTHELVEYDAIKLLDKGGIERFGHTSRLYDANVERVEVPLARVWSPDGRVTVVPPSAITDSVPESLQRTALYGRMRLLDIEFTNAVEGSVIEFRLVHHRRVPWNGKRFWELSYTQDFEPMLDTRFSFDSPDRLPYEIATPGMPDLQPQVQRLNGRTVLRWHLQNRPALVQEPASPPLRQLATQIQVSSFTSWDDFATWARTYWDTVVTPDPAILSKTASLVAAKTTDEARIISILTWLEGEKKTVRTPLDLDDLAPATAAQAFRAPELLPLDRAVLLTAMLRAASLRAFPAFVASSDHGDPTRGVPSLQQFNRVLVVVAMDGGWRWIDPSSGTLDILGAGLNDRPALILNGSGQLTRTPITPAHANREEIDGVARLDPDGSMETRLRISEHGANRLMWQSTLSRSDRKEQQQLFQLVVSGINPTAVLRDFYVPSLTAGPVQMTLSFEESRAGSRTPDGDGFQFAIPLLPQRRLIGYARLPVERRQYPLVFGSTAYEERRLRIVLPNGWTVRSLPRSVTLANAVGSHQVDVRAEGRTITYYSRLILRRTEIPVAEYPLYKALMEQMNECVDDRVIIRPPATRPEQR